jgi:hypothetical protein
MLLFFFFPVLNTAVDIASETVQPRAANGILLFLLQILAFLMVIAFVMFSPMILATLTWIMFGLRGFLPPRSGELSKRKQLAALYALKNEDSPAAIERAIQDDEFFVERTGRFLSEHRRTPPPKLLDERGRNRFRGESKLVVLANALQRSIGVTRDNELYILFLEPTDLAKHLEPLLRAVRAARAKHHQVLVLLAEPVDVPAEPEQKKRKRISLGEVIRSSLADDYRENYEQVRRQLVRAGASLVNLEATDTIRAILNRLDRLRGGRVLR